MRIAHRDAWRIVTDVRSEPQSSMQDLVNELVGLLPFEGANIETPLRVVSVPLFDSTLLPTFLTYDEMRDILDQSDALELQPDVFRGDAGLIANVTFQQVVRFVAQEEEDDSVMYIPMWVVNLKTCPEDHSGENQRKRKGEEEEEEDTNVNI